MLTVRQIKPIQCVFYIIGQMLGGFFGGLFVYLLHMDLFHKYDDGNRQIIGDKGTGDIFFTIRASGVHNINALFDQIVGTAVLMIFIMALNKVKYFHQCSVSSRKQNIFFFLCSTRKRTNSSRKQENHLHLF